MGKFEANLASAPYLSADSNVRQDSEIAAARVVPDPMASLLAHVEPRCLVTHVNLFSDDQPRQWSSHSASFHYVLEGSCDVDAPLEPGICLKAGDFLTLSGSGNYTAKANTWPCRMLSGDIKSNGFDITPLLPTSPTIHQPTPDCCDTLLAQMLPLVTDTLRSNQEGGIAVVNLMLSVVVLESIRERLLNMPLGSIGWVQAFQDDDLGKVLSAMLQNPELSWTVEKLAEAGCMSRSTFARRFREIVGESPIDVLTTIRMQTAIDLLPTSLSLKAISQKSGYRSLSAFTNAFRKRFGITPTQFRSENS
ncbi:helix-turn-helix domain-containing protein [bacterium]|nr:helix-turn-helix domain-containing protein [bacterium]